MRSVDLIQKDLENCQKSLEIEINKINELEQNPIILKYIERLNDYEKIKKTINKVKIELKESEMAHCDHYLVMIPRPNLAPGLLDGEVALCCLKCGISNVELEESSIPLKRMQEIMHTTLHHGRYVYDGLVTDLNYAKRIYQELLTANMTEEDLKTALNDFIWNHEVKLNAEEKIRNK